MRALVALPLLGLVLAGCAKGPGLAAVNQYTRLRFSFTMAGDVTTGDPPTFSSNYIYIVAIRPLFGNAPIDDGFGPIGVYSTTTGNPKNGFVEGRPTRYVIYDPTAPTGYRIRKFGTRTPTSDDDNPIDLAQISDVGTVVQGSDPQTSGFTSQLGFDLYTNDLVDTSSGTDPQSITAIQFNIIACNKALTSSGQASGRVADALGNINNLGVSGKGYRQVYINTSTGYTNSASSDPETANDTYHPSSDNLPPVDIVNWTLDVARP